jgi:hypothetical protein
MSSSQPPGHSCIRESTRLTHNLERPTNFQSKFNKILSLKFGNKERLLKNDEITDSETLGHIYTIFVNHDPAIEPFTLFDCVANITPDEPDGDKFITRFRHLYSHGSSNGHERVEKYVIRILFGDVESLYETMVPNNKCTTAIDLFSISPLSAEKTSLPLPSKERIPCLFRTPKHTDLYYAPIIFGQELDRLPDSYELTKDINPSKKRKETRTQLNTLSFSLLQQNSDFPLACYNQQTVMDNVHLHSAFPVRNSLKKETEFLIYSKSTKRVKTVPFLYEYLIKMVCRKIGLNKSLHRTTIFDAVRKINEDYIFVKMTRRDVKNLGVDASATSSDPDSDFLRYSSGTYSS